MREGILKFNAGDWVHLSGVVTCYNKLDCRFGHGKIVSVQMQETRPYAVQLKDSTGGWCSASEVDLCLISRPNGREVPEIPVGSRVRACGVSLGGEHVDSHGILDSTDLTNFPYGVRFESGHLVWFQKHSVYPAEAERAAEYQVSDVSGTCAHDKPGGEATMLAIGARVTVQGSSSGGKYINAAGSIAEVDIFSHYCYAVQLDDGTEYRLPASAIRAWEPPTPQAEKNMKIYKTKHTHDEIQKIEVIALDDSEGGVRIYLKNVKDGTSRFLLRISDKGIDRCHHVSSDLIDVDSCGRVAIID